MAPGRRQPAAPNTHGHCCYCRGPRPTQARPGALPTPFSPSLTQPLRQNSLVRSLSYTGADDDLQLGNRGFTCKMGERKYAKGCAATVRETASTKKSSQAGAYSSHVSWLMLSVKESNGGGVTVGKDRIRLMGGSRDLLRRPPPRDRLASGGHADIVPPSSISSRAMTANDIGHFEDATRYISLRPPDRGSRSLSPVHSELRSLFLSCTLPIQPSVLIREQRIVSMTGYGSQHRCSLISE